MTEFQAILKQTLIITSFVFSMMLMVEYINVITRGKWQTKLSKSKFGQYILSILLGAVPGCLGAFTVVSLYSHGIVSFGALTAAMIATSGDEAFVMFSLFPLKALLITGIISITGLVFGYLTDKFFRRSTLLNKNKYHELEVHKSEIIPQLNLSSISTQLKSISFPRGLMIGILAILLILLFMNPTDLGDPAWIKTTLLLVNIFALFVVITVPDHFLEEHLWKHVLKKHLLRIFLWTFGALIVVAVLTSFFNLEALIQANKYIVLIIAVLIGVIPESGPNLIFVSLFAAGALPLSILLANSAVQDGHGTLPLLAVSGKSFILLKTINVIAGLLIGFLAISMGF